jgi:hypothetical protein
MRLVSVAIAAGVLATGSRSSAATRPVATNGVGSATCGTQQSELHLTSARPRTQRRPHVNSLLSGPQARG